MDIKKMKEYIKKTSELGKARRVANRAFGALRAPHHYEYLD